MKNNTTNNTHCFNWIRFGCQVFQVSCRFTREKVFVFVHRGVSEHAETSLPSLQGGAWGRLFPLRNGCNLFFLKRISFGSFL